MEQYVELYEKLSRLQWLMQRSHLRRHSAWGPAGDPMRGQGRVMAMLRLQEEISTKDLSYLLGIRQQSLNELLSKLERAGYIVRTPSEADRRVMLVRLTDKGREAPSRKPDYSNIFGCLSETECTAFGEYLDRVIAALQAEVGVDESDGDRDAWMHGFRERIGDERFERMVGPRGRGPRDGRAEWARGPWGAACYDGSPEDADAYPPDGRHRGHRPPPPPHHGSHGVPPTPPHMWPHDVPPEDGQDDAPPSPVDGDPVR